MTKHVNQEQIEQWEREQAYLKTKLNLNNNSEVSSLINEELSEDESIICGIDVAYKLDITTNEEVAYC